MPEEMLKAEHLKKVFSGKKSDLEAVRDVSFVLKKGECLGLVGESGSGKSTIGKMLTRLVDVTEGRIWLMGNDVTYAKGKQVKEIYHQMQMVFQMPRESFDPRHTLGDGIAETLRNRGMGKREAKRRVAELLERCGLPAEYGKRYPHQVSGGQCQRAAIARALAAEPAILICDEATSALDVTVQRQILDLLLDLKETEEISILMITHDLALVKAVCDRVLVLHQGEIIESGSPDQVMEHPQNAYTQSLAEAGRALDPGSMLSYNSII